MANRAYADTNTDWMSGNLAWLSDNLKVVLCTSGYSPNTLTGGDHFLSVIAGGNIVATSGNLASKTLVGGVADAADLTFTAVSGSTVTQFVLYNDTGSGATSELIFLWDTATNLPVTPNGGNITIQWANSPNYILTLSYAGLSAVERARARTVWGRIMDAVRAPWDQTASGIWTPSPTLVMG